MATVSGEQMTWHKVTIDFETAEEFTEEASTFRDYRLDVTFTNADTGEVITVPGYFAADGDAANTGATSGNIWRVNFNPPSEGDWTYEASFRTGEDIAIIPFEVDPDAGTAVASIDGDTGSIAISETDKTGEDFRAKGMIVQDEGTHYLQHQGDGDYFIRGGPGIPENFLANPDIDGTPDGRHAYENHVDDFNAGDPTWNGDQGQAIIGAVNYLAEQGQNTIYVMTNTAGGDGQDVWPWVGDFGDINKHDSGITSAEVDAFSTYDVSKLSQWEVIFDHMDEQGIYKNVLLQETENDQLLNGGTEVDGSSLSVERMVYMREMVARYGHSNGIQWNVGEENTNTDEERVDQTEYLKSIDGYDHLVVVHSFPGDKEEVFDPLLGVEDFDGTSFQTSAQNIRDEIAEYRDASAEAGDPWVLAWDEDSSNNSAIDLYTNDPNTETEQLLREAFWGTLTVGGSGGNWYVRGTQGHGLDQNYDTFDAHASLWTWTSAATSFFNTYIPFWEMTEDDEATADADDFVMSKDGEYYVIYLPYGEAGDVQLDLSDHEGESFDVFWYNPRTGGELIADAQVDGGATVQIGGAPADGDKDWVLLVRNVDLPDVPTLPGETTSDPVDEPAANPEAFQGEGGTIVIEAESADAKGDWRETTIDGETVMLWDAASSNYRTVDPEQALSYSFIADEDGTYYISMHSARVKSTMSASELFEDGGTGDPRTDTGNDVYVSVVDVETGEVVQEPIKLYTFLGGTDESLAFGTTFDADGAKRDATVDLEAGREYELVLTGRSDGYALDMITINNGGFLRDADLPESPVVGDQPPTPEPTPVNEAPIARNDVAETEHDTSLVIDVLANDSDPDGTTLTLTDVSYDGDTAVVSIVDGAISVNPLKAATDARVETVTYTVRDADGATDTATLTVNVAAAPVTPEPEPEPVNEAPVARNDSAETEHDTTILVDVLGNDSDPEGGGLTLTDVSYDGDTAQVSIVDGQIKVNPLRVATEERVETISYTVTDEEGLSSTATLSVNVSGEILPEPEPEPAPTIVLSTVNADDDTTIGVLENGGTLTVEDLSAGFNFTAETDVEVGSMVFSLDGGDTQVENFAPYAAFGNIGSDFNAQALTLGDHALNVQIYSEAGGKGELLGEETFTFTVAEPEPESILDFFIANAGTDELIMELADGDEIAAADLGDMAVFYATSDDADVASVSLTFQGDTNVEKVTPYALFGDIEGDFNRGLELEAGDYTLEYAAYDDDGSVLENSQIDFTLI